uniref:Cytochrome P450 716B1-like n=1 Tax=Tanacetum cinerariifolium TaxID=118510 RepID=A0A6L2NYV6_TANCI|nr:cytochrome P450 716B1-like [Tanacetum cinerariifolium]
MTKAKFDIKKFNETGDFELWRVKMHVLSVQDGCEAPLEVLPTYMKVEAKAKLNKKAHNKVLREVIEETTTTGLLASNNSIYSEIAQVFIIDNAKQEKVARSKAPGESLKWEYLSKMKYTWRVASEVLWITPPVSWGFRRAKQDIEYEEFIISKEWQVAPLMTHMDKDIFQNSTISDPARFETSPPPYSYVPFGAGPRMCLGIELAKMETLDMMHRLVTRFRWELVNKEETSKRIPMPEFDQGLLVRITPI